MNQITDNNNNKLRETLEEAEGREVVAEAVVIKIRVVTGLKLLLLLTLRSPPQVSSRNVSKRTRNSTLPMPDSLTTSLKVCSRQIWTKFTGMPTIRECGAARWTSKRERR